MCTSPSKLPLWALGLILAGSTGNHRTCLRALPEVRRRSTQPPEQGLLSVIGWGRFPCLTPWHFSLAPTLAELALVDRAKSEGWQEVWDLREPGKVPRLQNLRRYSLLGLCKHGVGGLKHQMGLHRKVIAWKRSGRRWQHLLQALQPCCLSLNPSWATQELHTLLPCDSASTSVNWDNYSPYLIGLFGRVTMESFT